MPRVSVIVPCYNEQDTIALLLQALLSQAFPLAEMEVIIADGLSSDQTRQRLADFQAAHPQLAIRVVDNPKRIIPAAVNCGIAAARGEIIVRMDAHSVPGPDYIQRCVQALEQGRGANVGGVWEIRPRDQGWVARSIAAAAAHPLGVGDARYRYTEAAGEVDTVPFGAFYKALIQQIGPFDENLLTNEDYEFNVRIRQSGRKVWLDPAIRSVYFARRSFKELAVQYLRYGYWKARMLRRYPGTIRWRQALPPLFVLSLMGLAALAPWFSFAAWTFVLELSAYVLVLFLVSLNLARRKRDWTLALGVPLAIAVMHLTWGSAFLWSIVVR